MPELTFRKGVYTINPGSAGPRRFSLPITLGILEIDDGVVGRFELVRLV
jgi:predicted phosphodiesterase